MASYLNFFISVVTMTAPMEKRITEGERHLWYFLKKRQMPTKYYMISALLDINFFIS